MELERKVKLNVEATNVNKEIIKSVLGQLSDGIWENSKRMTKYWDGVNVIEEDGELVLEFKEGSWDRWNSFYWTREKEDQEIRDIYARLLKKVCKEEEKDKDIKDLFPFWNKDCEFVLDYIGYKEEIKVSDCYKVYALLKGRNI